jgi:ABC-type nitrate/sulfonate/bicarbonate transport system permease component
LAQYDANILQDFADRLYAKAAWITVKCCIVGALLGIGLTFILAAILKISNPALNTSDPAFIPFAVLGGLLGIAVGQHKAFQYKLQAQLTLCQMQTEFNTRQKASTS